MCSPGSNVLVDKSCGKSHGVGQVSIQDVSCRVHHFLELREEKVLVSTATAMSVFRYDSLEKTELFTIFRDVRGQWKITRYDVSIRCILSLVGFGGLESFYV